MTTVPAVEVARNFAAYVDRVASTGERFTLLHEGRPVAELGPVLTVVRAEDLPAVLSTLARLTPEDAAALAREPSVLLTPVTAGPLDGR
jgi:antitoxin (DNA-binding transcriptional repressor) of toxin-antitoxin stability system